MCEKTLMMSINSYIIASFNCILLITHQSGQRRVGGQNLWLEFDRTMAHTDSGKARGIYNIPAEL